MQPIDVSYEYTRDDFVVWHRYLLRSTPEFKRGFWWQIGFALLGIFAAVAISITKSLPLYFTIIVGVICAAVLVINLRSGGSIFAERTLQDLSRKPEIQCGFGRITLSITDSGMLERTQSAESHVKWNGVRDVIEIDGLIAIRLTNGMAAVIPSKSYSCSIPFQELPRQIDEIRRRHIV